MAALREVPFGLYYGSVDATPLFVLLAGLYVERTGDLETADGAVAGDRGGARLDRRARRSATATASSNIAARASRARQPGLEGFARRDLPCRRPPRPKAPIALAEVQGYVYAAKQAARALRAPLGHAARRAPARSRCASALPGASRPPSGARNSAPMRWRSTAPSSRAACAPPMPASCCSPASRAPSAPRWSANGLLAAALLLRLGHSHRGPRRGALQSDVLPQRLGLAARQRADRAGPRALRPEATRSANCSRACSTPRPTWTCGGCRNCSAASSASAAAGRRSIPSPARRRPGRAPRRSR